jgi:outer membrane protein TolC
MSVPKYGGPPGARNAQRLDALGAVRYALDHAPSLLAQRASIASVDSSFTRARAAEYPTATGQLQNQIARSRNQSGQFAQFGLSPTSNFSQNTAQLSSTYDLYNGTRQLAAGQAKRQLQGAILELARLQEQTTVSVSNAFFALAAQHGIVTLDENDLRYQKALLDSARASERVGRVAGVDVLRAQVNVARATSTLVQAQTDEENARESLAVQVGAPADTDFELPATLPEPPAPTTSPDVLGTLAKMNRPEIAAARAALDASKFADAQVDSDLRPTVQANASFGSQVSPTSFVQQQQQIDASNAQAIASFKAQQQLFPNLNITPPTPIPNVDRHRPGFWQFQIVSNFTIPLYDYGTRAAAHRAARAQVDSSLASLYSAYDSVQADVDAANRNVGAATQRLALAKLSSQAARETARVAQLQYKSGLISFTDVTQTEQTALGAENDLVAARVNYVTALVKLRISLAPPSPAAAVDFRGL